jgi:diaminohydroxyphosphoribosylaminopyrimidine deaminase / 5-amino-6-(5-phosphoribosylamino)uracil reductase
MPAALSAVDRAHLARAIALAESSRARTGPNPAVGCVIARDGRVVGEGATGVGGSPHAEVVALRAAGASAAGASVYVTLSPCTHHGRTPPCADALIAAGIGRAVIGLDDPNPVAGDGAARLIGDGVDAGVLDPRDPYALTVARQLEGFLRVVTGRRPHLTLKLAQTTAGALVAPDGNRWITSVAARRAVHRVRRSVDAVLVGSGTVLADDQRLDVRLVETWVMPRPVVLDARLRTPLTARLLRPGAVIVTTAAAPQPRAADLERRGASVIRVAAGRGGGVDLADAMGALAGMGITSVLAEPGPILARALLEARLVDRLVLHVADVGATGPVRAAVPIGGDWRLERLGGAGSDAILELVPTGGAGHVAAA